MTPTPPPSLREVAIKVNHRLDRLFDEQSARWTELDPRLAEAIEELRLIVASGGKRLRAGFCYWAWRGTTGALGPSPTPTPTPGNGGAAPRSADGYARPEDIVIDVGAALELLQAFALIHDDIMDDSATRRGRPTVHVNQARRLTEEGWQGEPRRFGEGVAILIGDLSHAYADSLMAETGPAARQLWDELRIEVNLGQYLDLRSAAAGELDLETAKTVSMFKSALYTIVRPLQLGTCLRQPANPELLALLECYGRPLGRAFQLKDDLLGVLGDRSLLGKPVGDDLREGKPTELLSLALERASGPQRATLAGLGRRDLSDTDVAAMVEILVSTGAVADIEQRIADLVDEAISVVPSLPFDNVAKEALCDLADYVAARNS